MMMMMMMMTINDDDDDDDGDGDDNDDDGRVASEGYLLCNLAAACAFLADADASQFSGADPEEVSTYVVSRWCVVTS